MLVSRSTTGTWSPPTWAVSSPLPTPEPRTRKAAARSAIDAGAGVLKNPTARLSPSSSVGGRRQCWIHSASRRCTGSRRRSVSSSGTRRRERAGVAAAEPAQHLRAQAADAVALGGVVAVRHVHDRGEPRVGWERAVRERAAAPARGLQRRDAERAAVDAETALDVASRAAVSRHRRADHPARTDQVGEVVREQATAGRPRGGVGRADRAAFLHGCSGAGDGGVPPRRRGTGGAGAPQEQVPVGGILDLDRRLRADAGLEPELVAGEGAVEE